jgi:hypothetical protein
MLTKIYRQSIISMILILFTLCGQNYAQWQRTNLPSSVKVNTVAIRDSSIFAGTNGDGIYVSIDNGENWNSVNEGLQSKVIHTILINGNSIFAGTETGASISTNNGMTWDPIDSGLSDLSVWSFAVSNIIPGDTIIFAGTWSGVYSSTNNGTNWKPTGLSNTTMPVHSIIVFKNYIFAATLGSGVFNSQNNGLTWDDVSIQDFDQVTGNITIIPVYSVAVIDTVVEAGAGPGNLYYYPMSPQSIFTTDNKFTLSNSPILCFAVSNANLFAGNTTGDIFLHNTGGSTWKRITPSLKDEAIYSLALNNSYIFAGTGSGIWRLRFPATISNVNDIKKTLTGFVLEQNYPNPFNSSTQIKFSIPYNSRVSLKVYNILGKLVGDLVDKYMAAGTYEVKFSPGQLTSGIYFYSLATNESQSTKKLILLK